MADPGDFDAEWTFSLTDGRHRVQFQHGTTSGKRVVVVDGKEMLRKNWMFHLVGKETFDVGGKKACIHIDPKGMSYEYWLEVGGKSLEKFVEQRRKSTKTWLPVLKGKYHRVVLGEWKHNASRMGHDSLSVCRERYHGCVRGWRESRDCSKC